LRRNLDQIVQPQTDNWEEPLSSVLQPQVSTFHQLLVTSRAEELAEQVLNS
jgi:hypothetical protein